MGERLLEADWGRPEAILHEFFNHRNLKHRNPDTAAAAVLPLAFRTAPLVSSVGEPSDRSALAKRVVAKRGCWQSCQQSRTGKGVGISSASTACRQRGAAEDEPSSCRVAAENDPSSCRVAAKINIGRAMSSQEQEKSNVAQGRA